MNDGGVWAGRAKGANTPPSLYVAHERMHSARESYREGAPRTTGRGGTEIFLPNCGRQGSFYIRMGEFRWQGHKKSKEIILITHNENETRKKKKTRR